MTIQRVADAISAILTGHGVTDAFMVTGGGAMHLNDAFGADHRLRKIFVHHEQAASIAAESYARLSGKPALVNVTTGPGGVNALNGVYGAYVDSIPMIVVSGQVKRETCAFNYDVPLRQLGDQEVDIVSMVRGITKYATVLQRPDEVRRVVEKAIHLAKSGRPGPVWIDVPIDVQAAPIDWQALPAYDPTADSTDDDLSPNSLSERDTLAGEALASEAAALLADLASAQRPVILVGSGIRMSGTLDNFLAFADRIGAPVVTAWNSHDLISHDHPLYVGRPGTVGDRAGNLAVQTADYLLVLGCRLNIRQISYNWPAFARHAKVAMVDVDRAELAKPTLRLHRPIHADLRDFFETAAQAPFQAETRQADRTKYLAWARGQAEAFPVVLDEYWATASPINPYCFGAALFDALEPGDIIVTGDGTACVTMFQCAKIKEGQRLYTNSGCASMGYDLPAAIGAFYASGAKRIICLAGDGSIMMNLQELQTIAGNQLPVKIFLLNNDGYHSIRQTQQNYFPENTVGCGPDSGLSFPNFQRVALAFDIPTSGVDNHRELADVIDQALAGDGPHLCEVVLDKAQQFAPKLASRRLDDGTMVSPGLEDMAPFLPREQLAQLMEVVETA